MSDALGADDELRPDLWWNAASYDLCDFVPHEGAISITASTTPYFQMLDVCEAVGHEFVATARWRRRRALLWFRKQIADPFDISARPFVPAIPTLVLVRKDDDGTPRFLLHERDSRAVASAGGQRHVFGGQFQPSSRHSVGVADEADVWLSVAREIAEELLDAKHADGSAGGRLTFEDDPLRQLEELRRRGLLRAWCVGMGIDPLTLWPDILTVVVVDEDALSAQFPHLAQTNEEGVVVGALASADRIQGFAFEPETIKALTADPRLHPAAASCLRLAWRHRATLGLPASD